MTGSLDNQLSVWLVLDSIITPATTVTATKNLFCVICVAVIKVAVVVCFCLLRLFIPKKTMYHTAVILLSSIISIQATVETVKCPQNVSCAECVQSISCYYCYKDSKCHVYPFVIPKPVPECGDSLKDLSWKTCTVTGNTFAIIVAVIAGLIGLLVLWTLLYCYCIKPCVRRYNDRVSANWDRKRMHLQSLHEERRRNRAQQREAIRAKYGLPGPGGAVYERF